jgi:hypothetical protein
MQEVNRDAIAAVHFLRRQKRRPLRRLENDCDDVIGLTMNIGPISSSKSVVSSAFENPLG